MGEIEGVREKEEANPMEGGKCTAPTGMKT